MKIAEMFSDYDNKIYVQNGYTKFTSSKLKMLGFISSEELDKYYSSADLIITHAGTGSIIKGVKMGKKVIAVPRLSKYGEHVDDHQIEITKKFTELGCIIPVIDEKINDLSVFITSINTFKPKELQLDDIIVSVITEIISKNN